MALLVFIEVVLDRTTPEVFDAFKQSVQLIPEVLECHMVAGGFDYLVKARVKDMARYREFLERERPAWSIRTTVVALSDEALRPYRTAAFRYLQHLARVMRWR